VRTYAVSGAGSGIGLAISQYLRKAGSQVIGVDLHEADVIADLSTKEGRLGAATAVKKAAGDGLHGIVACAGVSTMVPGRLVIAVNFFGARDFITSLAPLLHTEGNVGAVAIASAASSHPADQRLVRSCLEGSEEQAVAAAGDDGRAAYGASKTALVRWVRRAAPTDEWAGAGRSLNAVSPGLVLTPMMAEANAAEDPRFRERYPMPLHGPAVADQIAPLVAHLIGPENSHVSGQNIFIDGASEAQVRGDVIW